jgi:cytochrome c-type biogenesis protein CcmH/NrfG
VNKSTRGLLAIIVVFTVLAYLNGLKGEFVYDDVRVVVENKYITGFKYLGDIFTTVSFWGEDCASRSYRPVFTTLHAIVYQLSGQNPLGYHLFNILFHAMNVCLVFLLLLKIGGSRILAFAASLLFGLHPLHTEAVTGITGGAEVLAAFFFLIAFYLAVRKSVFNYRDYLLIGAAFTAALLSKENTITFIGVLLCALLLFRKEGRVIKTLISQHVITLMSMTGGIAMAYLIIRLQIFGSLSGIQKPPFYDNPIAHLWVFPAIFTALKVLGLYLWKFIVPLDLSVDYSYPIIKPLDTVKDFHGLLLMLFILALVVSLYFYRNRWYWFGILIFLITVSIVSNLIVRGPTIMGERLMYLPLLGLCIVTGHIIDQAYRIKSRVINIGFTIIFAVVFIAFALLTIRRNQDWSNAFTLWNSTIKTHPLSFRAYHNRANEWMDRKELEKAKADLKTAIRICPGDHHLYYTLGRVYDTQNNLDSAVIAYTRALEKRPYAQISLMNRGIDYLMLKKYGPAEKDFLSYIQVNPNNHYTYYHLATIYFEEKKYNQALEAVNRAILIDRQNPDAFLLKGKINLELKNYEKGQKDLTFCTALEGDNAQCYFYLGYCEILLGNLEKAKEYLQRAIDLYPECKKTILSDTSFLPIQIHFNK